MKPLFFFISMFCLWNLKAQTGRLSSPADLSAHRLILQNNQRKADTSSTTNIVGSPYLSNDFRVSRIMLTNGKVADSVLVKFNAYFNEIHAIYKGDLIALNDVLQLSYLDDPNDTTTLMVFRSGYPKYNQQDEKTFYQVVTGSDSIQLLKLIKKKIQTYEIAGTGVIQKREFQTDLYWFVYSTKDGIHPVKMNKKSILKALPSEAKKIEALIMKTHLTIKNEDDLISFIELLIQP